MTVWYTLSMDNSKYFTSFLNESVDFVENIKVKKGVVCDIYSFKNNQEKDLGIVRVETGKKTPLQKVLKGDKTLEGYLSGSGVLTITNLSGQEIIHSFEKNSDISEVEVNVGELMQWESIEDLVFYELCYPPYQEGRYQNL